MFKEIYLCFRNRIEKGCYHFDIIVQEYGKSSFKSEMTVGTIITRTLENGKINYTHNFSKNFLDTLVVGREEHIKRWSRWAQEETKRLNDFFATDS